MRAKYAIDPALKGVERTRARKLAYYYANKDKVVAQRESNKEAISAQRKEYYAKNKPKIAEAQQNWREMNRDYAKAKTAEWRAADPQRAIASKKAYYEANKERMLEKQKSWASENAEAIKEYHRGRYRKMPEVYIAAASKRRARQLLATPKWDEELTEFAVIEAADLVRKRKQITGVSWHTDHIVPLRGKTVSGLHVWNNIQVIPATVNMSKSNAFNG